jgi:hypothetical protein
MLKTTKRIAPAQLGTVPVLDKDNPSIIERNQAGNPKNPSKNAWGFATLRLKKGAEWNVSVASCSLTI